jgi:hypothetical protein
MGIKTGLLSAAVVAAGMLAGTSAFAVTATFESCVGTNPDYDISGKVSSATDCTISNDFTNDPSSNPLVVNTTPGFFGITNWAFLAKDEGTDATGTSGKWNFTAALAALNLPAGMMVDQLMLVFKSGQDTTLVAYLVDATSGTWSSPFTEPPFDFPGSSPKSVSHISAYYTVAPIPLPAAGWMLLAGIGGLAAMRRRRKAA